MLCQVGEFSLFFIGEVDVFRRINKGWTSVGRGFVVPLTADTI